MDTDEATRVRQGACASTSPGILRALATDPSVTVRASLALNPALPDQISAILATDTDARVRKILSRKLAMLTPGLTGDASERVQRNAVANLTAMVADAALRVRISLAEAVKNLPNGPRDIILRLAHDPEVMVCEPVIRFSPMLTQDDLVTLIATCPPPSTVLAVAKRPKINATVSDAIVESASIEAISALLANPTAQIREATLDSLAAQSEEQTDWQAPLVRRPHLSTHAQRMLAEIVTGHLLEIMAARTDLDPKITHMLRLALRPQRLVPPASMTHQLAVSASQAPIHSQPLGHPQAAAGKVDDSMILEALHRNQGREVIAMLAAKANVPIVVIERACALRSAKGIVSLAWKAGLTAQTAVVLQVTLATVPPDAILQPGLDGAFPLSDDEMRWQLTFLDISDHGPRAWVPRRRSD